MLKVISLSAIVFLIASCATMKNTNTTIEGTYDVSCGICNFEMTGDDCALAIRIDGKDYYVEGSAIDEHGDAHAKDGLCTVVRKAKVKGVIKKGVFVAEKIELIEE
ncbi:MAG: hypothetical protein HRT57_02275 [Crocinitomicaceae bacterium]|nr:hypothetical protein [Crocinitomicaceae bacterium]